MNDNDPTEGFVMADSVRPLLERLTVMANFSDGPITFEREQLLAMKRVIDRQAAAYDRLAMLAKDQAALIENIARIDEMKRDLRRELAKGALALIGFIAVVIMSNIILG